MDRWRSRFGWLDVLPPFVVLVIGLMGTGPSSRNQVNVVREPDVLAYALVVLAASVLVVRRERPMLALAVCGSCIVVFFAVGYPFGPILLPGPVAVYAVFERVDLRRSIIAAATFLVVTTVVFAPRLHSEHGGVLGMFVWFVAWSAVVTAPAAVGLVIRTRRQAAQEMQAEQARRAVSEERLRMAQDLHDAVGHGLAVVAMQAGVALHVLDRDRDRARESLEAIRSASRDALNDLRAQLDELRAPTGEAVRRPNPGLAEISVLVERMRAGGLALRLELDGGADVPDDAAHAAYRIVQESLTNVLRHADGATADVRVLRRRGELVVEVADSGRSGVLAPVGSAVEPGSGGTGIDGMRARAESTGGTLTAGALDGGGFLVRATLPIDDESRTP